MKLRRLARTSLLALIMFTSLGGALGPLGSTVPTARAATTLDVCGTVTVYVKPSVLLVGALTIGPVVHLIAAGTTVPSSVEVGANLCVRLTIAAGTITNIVFLEANGTTSLKICGTITAFAAATATGTGSLTIAGRVLKIAVATDLPASVHLGADLCLDLDLNALGQIKDGTVKANATVSVKICGTVTAHAAASLTQTGSLKIAGRTFVLALGSSLPASVDVGANLCLTLELNGYAQVQDGSAQVNVTATVKICGTVTAYAAATLTQTGNLAIGGRSFVIGLGADLPAAVRAGADLCLTLQINVFGQVKDGSAVAHVTTTLEVCGRVEALVTAGATTDGSLTIGSLTKSIAAGTVLSSQIKVGAYVKLRLVLDVFGRIDDAVVLKVGLSLAAACGTATAPSPSGSPAPSSGPAPSGTPSPSASPAPSGSVAPTAATNPAPSSSPAPDSSGPSCETGSGPTTDTTGDDGGIRDATSGPLPDTASLARTGGLIVAASIPFLAIGGILLGAWAFTARRRRLALVAASSATTSGETVR